MKINKRKHKSGVSIRKLKKVRNTENKIVSRIADFLEMPEEILSDNTKITLIDNRYLYLEGNNQIEDYYDYYIKIRTKKSIIILDGKNMEIKGINDSELSVEGEIVNITYERRGVE